MDGLQHNKSMQTLGECDGWSNGKVEWASTFTHIINRANVNFIIMNSIQKLAEITGSRAYERFTGNQIAKISQEKSKEFSETEVCL